MPTWKDVRTIALALPQTEVSTWYGTPGVKVAGKGFLRYRTESDGGLVVLCDSDKKAALLRSGDPAFYTTPHYDGYPSILVDLSKVTRRDLAALITEAWRRKAPLRLLKEFDDSSVGGGQTGLRGPRSRPDHRPSGVVRRRRRP